MHVAGVLLGTPVWPLALVAALLVLAVAGGPPRWLAPVALAPLILQAALTVPRVHTGGYQWLIAAADMPRPSVLDALDSSFRIAGALLLATAVLLTAARAERSHPAAPRAERSRLTAATVLPAGLLVLAYATVRVVTLDRRDPSQGSAGFAAAVLVPVVFALTATALGLVTGRWLPALLLAISALPMIDTALDALPASGHAVPGADPTRLFGWDFLTPSTALPAPVPALTAALQLAGFLLLIGRSTRRSKPIRPYGG